MDFNVKKCKVMHIGRSNPKHKYFMNGAELKEVDSEKILESVLLLTSSQASNAKKLPTEPDLCSEESADVSIIETRKFFFVYTSNMSALTWSSLAQSGVPGLQRTLHYWRVSRRRHSE